VEITNTVFLRVEFYELAIFHAVQSSLTLNDVILRGYFARYEWKQQAGSWDIAVFLSFIAQ